MGAGVCDGAEARGPERHRELLAAIDIPQRSRGGSFEAVLERADALPRGRALDLPSGPGRLSEALRRLGFRVAAADLDAGVFQADLVPFCVVDLEAPLPYADGSFTLVHCGDGIEHMENPFAVLRELGRVLDDKGLLVVTTPNYGNVGRRVVYLATGSIAKPPRRAPPSARVARVDRGHISPLTPARLAWAAENAGLELVEMTTLLPRRRQWLLLPVALLILLYTRTLAPRRRADLFAEHTQSARMLLGGKKLVAVFRKSPREGGSA